MGYMRAHSIVVESFDDKLIREAHKEAKGIFGEACSCITSPQTNVRTAFFIAPDGSKEGWQESKDGDERRREFVDLLESMKHEDGSSSISYIEVMFGDDEGEAEIINHN